ncbi:uncharacterized protein UMAG_01841 [Mycosarcoma maydis]|uniref:Uncharacterized protein n=1 Tax=Mycosarcoma maydis TaxID=5270 RepID=A0A0D1CWB6_MYCMD|nr:uncharacterized protein UMAG_01841 [Ustilago maydis 521]KIS70683.1 hypothetical protein UMAG_01841 [Ustilago maydis 521]|eukprot:XP_011387782.1 hypothetical protein UMAG_01841 [Ustilago maydis 521]
MSGTVWTQIEPAKMTGGNEGIQGTASWGFQGHFTKGRTSRILLSRLSLSKTDTNIIKCRFKGVRSGGGIQLEIRNKKGRGRGSSKAANETLKSNWTTARQTESEWGREKESISFAIQSGLVRNSLSERRVCSNIEEHLAELSPDTVGVVIRPALGQRIATDRFRGWEAWKLRRTETGKLCTRLDATEDEAKSNLQGATSSEAGVESSEPTKPGQSTAVIKLSLLMMLSTNFSLLFSALTLLQMSNSS